MPEPISATDRMAGPQARATDALTAGAPAGLGDAAATEPQALEAAATADRSLEYWYFCSNDSPFRPL